MPLEAHTSEQGLFPELPASTRGVKVGVLPSQDIQDLISTGKITARIPILEEQIQPASLDLRVGDMAHRVQASFLPGQHATVEQRVNELRMSRVDLTSSTVLEKGCVYIVPLLEEVHLPDNMSGKANPKSTTGRLDVFTRLITDYGVEFEHVPPGYKGKLYAEIVPGTFSIRLPAGTRLNQLRFFRGNPLASDTLITELDGREALVYSREDSPVKAQVDRGLRISVNLHSVGPSEIIAYKAKKNAPVIDLSKVNHYSPEEFWDPKYHVGDKGLILDPGDFYILASKEQIRVPPDYAAEMVPFDSSIGELRIHYAGFFDPGFGYGVSDLTGTRAVLEVRAHEVPFLIEHGQIVARLAYMRLLKAPEKVYGVGIGSSYQRQSLTLSKQFKKVI
jgi:dCTP deaminase